MHFIDRERELMYLNEAYQREGSQFIVIYGKRRVGKTELVRRFFTGIPHIYFLAEKSSEKDQMVMLSEKTGLAFQDDFLLSRGFGAWREFFRYVRDKGRIIVVVDEYPYLVESNAAIPSIFQSGWDEELKDSQVFLVLLGSSIGMMETEVLGYRSPLFGRRTGQILVEPLSFWDAKKFFPSLPFEEFLYIYAILGGVPAYLMKFDPGTGLWENIRKNILNPQAYLFAEPEFILREELREPRHYFSILRALSLGKRRAGEIINETGLEKNVIGKYLSVLADLRLIRREVPVTEKNPEKSKQGIHLVNDHFFRFWFDYVFPGRSFILEGEELYLLDRKIRPSMDDFVSPVFEEICRSLVRRRGAQELRFHQVGRWWSRRAEIDVVALNEDENAILLGEAKWSTRKVGTDVLAHLKEQAVNVEWGRPRRREYYALFSRAGFTGELKERASRERVLLYDFQEICREEHAVG
ncbi:MAG: ATP-binding protein [Candidatus Eremiobacteraeota bacterium]|nr:ATP-binding protein [Candidatus Eremiobacteraeota bacterium]